MTQMPQSLQGGRLGPEGAPGKDELHRRMASLAPGDHMACIYGSDEERRILVTAYVEEGLAQGDKILLLADEQRSRQDLGWSDGEVREAVPGLEAGRVRILPKEQSYTRQSVFDPRRTLDMFEEEARRARSEGFRSLRAAGDMSWALQGLPGTDRLIEYEARVNDLFRDRSGQAMCLYDQRRFTPGVLLGILATHPLVALGLTVIDNPYYVPPGDLLGPNEETARLESCFRTLVERKRAEEELREARDRLEIQVEERTRALTEANAALRKKEEELRAQTRHLEEMNTAMQVLLQHREEEKVRIQQDVAANVQKLVRPYLKRMEDLEPTGEMKTYLEIVRSNLQDVTAPLARSMFSQVGLTPTEMRVADLVRNGKSTKEIAGLLSVSTNAVSVHRHSIRRKLGLLNRKVNLRAHLQSYSG
jgi:DNA-binding CsgD family transcriptional regulator